MALVTFLNSIVIQIHWTHHPRQPMIWTAMESATQKTMTLMAMDYPTQQNKIQLRLLSSTMLILMVTESVMDHLLLQCLLVSALLVLMHSRTIQLLGLILMVTEGRMKSFLELKLTWNLTLMMITINGLMKTSLLVEPTQRTMQAHRLMVMTMESVTFLMSRFSVML